MITFRRDTSAANPSTAPVRAWWGLVPLGVVTALLLGLASSAKGQEFSRYLQCEGTVLAQGKSTPAHADFALRFNNRTALIQRSNVLPVGESLAYRPSPVAYSMTYRLRAQGIKVIAVPGWFHSTVLVLYPNLARLHQIRMSIDRQTGLMEGHLLNEEEQMLGSFEMQCQSRGAEDLPEPRF
ncbi:hypothetical protein C7444_12233 [Sphaerotilus hippei]|uniref:Uncharacterized protein n=1 Tax=Sphaerotilus hippei TaxID=744406 RepID=A0A318H6F9_9BURK|nr:hypothetical protein [Sphaerotilus hippei]PXW92858.1 hypothetical protein C7444_12233 [Sphaerotilus hippei]